MRKYAQWGRRSAGSKVLRILLNKVNQVDAHCGASAWGPFYTGASPPSLSREESKARDHILRSEGNGLPRAQRILNDLDGNSPLFCRITFVETLAALCKVYPMEVARKVTGASKEVRKVLWQTTPDRIEWLFNGLRVRRSITGPYSRVARRQMKRYVRNSTRGPSPLGRCAKALYV